MVRKCARKEHTLHVGREFVQAATLGHRSTASGVEASRVQLVLLALGESVPSAQFK